VRRPGIRRRELLKAAAAAGPAAALGRLGGGAAAAQAASGQLKGMNVVVFLTDQERAIQHFPPGWAAENLAGNNRLRRYGLLFRQAFTDACMCSPARSTWMTGFFPAQHGVKYTLEAESSPPKNPQVELPLDLPNLATVMKTAGLNPVYKGKFHCVKAAAGGENWVPQDVGQYGWTRWNPPDAGANQNLDQAGGGMVNNDFRYMTSIGDVSSGTEGVLQFLSSSDAKQQPFFLVVSLVNPHDVLFYPGNYLSAGYSNTSLLGDIQAPRTWQEDLSTKPHAQLQFKRMFQIGGGPIVKEKQVRAYLNFYGNLIKSSDNYLMQVLDALQAQNLIDNTLVIKTADHGDMGLSHGLRQKNFNFYEESLRVPLVYSNPTLFPNPRITDAMVSHVDFLPTMASLFGATATAPWQGVDYSSVVLDPSSSVQDYIVFTFDDFQSGQQNPPYPSPPNHVASLRENRWKLAEYFDPLRRQPSVFEMYDRATDPAEVKNLAYSGYTRTREQERQYLRLRRKLEQVQQARLAPL
jgi:arylsulfatase A-like enzyme